MLDQAVAAALTFNLLCSGTSSYHSLSTAHERPFSHEFRIDLSRGIYCSDDCRIVMPIAEIHPALIILERDRPSPALRGMTSTSIDRTSGVYRSLFVSLNGRDHLEMRGTCQVRPFTEIVGPPVRF